MKRLILIFLIFLLLISFALHNKASEESRNIIFKQKAKIIIGDING